MRNRLSKITLGRPLLARLAFVVVIALATSVTGVMANGHGFSRFGNGNQGQQGNYGQQENHGKVCEDGSFRFGPGSDQCDQTGYQQQQQCPPGQDKDDFGFHKQFPRGRFGHDDNGNGRDCNDGD